ncbi:MAG: signal peptidase I [Thermoanaerobaculia bacterium]
MDALLPLAALSRGPAARPVTLRERGTSAVARSALVALLFALFVRAFLLEVVSVPSESMSPTLEPGDQVLVNRFIYTGPAWGFLPRRPVTRGDVVLFRPPFDRRQTFVKRCVGLAGDWEGGGVLPPGALWVEGDARENSLDSRRFGAVSEDALEGRVLAVLWARSHLPGAGGRILRQVR